MTAIINNDLFMSTYAMSFEYFRKITGLLRTFNQYDNWSSKPEASRGQTIFVQTPSLGGINDVEDVVPSANYPATPNFEPGVVPVTLDQFKKTSFSFSDDQITKLQDGQFPIEMQGRLDSLVGYMSDFAWRKILASTYNSIGVAGVTPFANGLSELALAGSVLDELGVPVNNRQTLISSKAHANLIQVPGLTSVQDSGSDETLRKGIVTEVFDFQIQKDLYNPKNVGGTLNNGSGKFALINNVLPAPGATTITMDDTTLTGTLVAGDLFSVAGDTQQYVVTADATAAGNAITVSFQPGIKEDPNNPGLTFWVDNALVTFVDTHDLAGISMHPASFAFVSRDLVGVKQLGVGSGTLSNVMDVSMLDPMTGLSLGFALYTQYHQVSAEFYTLFGGSVIRPDAIVKILG